MPWPFFSHAVAPRSLRKANEIYQQLERHLQQMGLPIKSCGEDITPLRRALTAGLFPHAARRQPDGTYKVRWGCPEGPSSPLDLCIYWL
jgi:ATP-dependent RNA helicase DHX8/PRP22